MFIFLSNFKRWKYLHVVFGKMYYWFLRYTRTLLRCLIGRTHRGPRVYRKRVGYIFTLATTCPLIIIIIYNYFLSFVDTCGRKYMCGGQTRVNDTAPSGSIKIIIIVLHLLYSNTEVYTSCTSTTRIVI